MPKLKQTYHQIFSGLLFIGLFALVSTSVAKISFVEKMGMSSLVIAIILGIVYGNTLHHRLPTKLHPGITFSAKKLLRIAIILYGFRISFQQIISVGFEGLLLDIFVIITTLGFGTWVGMKWLKLDRDMALLVSAGSAICGAAAVLAIESILKSDAYKASVAVGTVVLFGTTAMFLFPFLQQKGLWGFSHYQFGLFAGASIHEVAQVVTAGNAISVEAGEIGVIVKMTRVLLLVPVLIYLSYSENRRSKNTRSFSKKTIIIPWFAVLFVGVIGINSLNILPPHWIPLINQCDTFLLTMAMAAIGMETQLNKLKQVGLKPLYLALILFFWLTITVYLCVKYAPYLFAHQ
jgi:uncharacterized integral membrane protein (TIGR00698 family)